MAVNLFYYEQKKRRENKNYSVFPVSQYAHIPTNLPHSIALFLFAPFSQSVTVCMIFTKTQFSARKGHFPCTRAFKHFSLYIRKRKSVFNEIFLVLSMLCAMTHTHTLGSLSFQLCIASYNVDGTQMEKRLDWI